MRRYVPLLIAGTAFLAAACGDAIAPTRSVSDNPNISLIDPSVWAAILPSEGTTAHVAQFMIPAAGGSVKVGDFTLLFPARAVCNPLTSGYGEDTWNSPCMTLAVDVPVTAIYWWENGQAYVDFLADLRFDPSKLVLIKTIRPALIGQTTVGDHEVLFWKRSGFTKVSLDEASKDWSLKSYLDPRNGAVYRRLKHFSGYSITSGAPCDDTVGDPDCVSDEGGFM